MKIPSSALFALTFMICACAHGHKPSTDFDEHSPAHPFLFGVSAPLREAPHGKVLREIDCSGSLHVVDRREGSTSVRIDDLAGWIDDADLRADPERCTGPLYVYDARIPEARGVAMRPTVLETADDDAPSSLPKRIYRVRQDDSGAKACVEARVESEGIIEGLDLAGPHEIVTWGLRTEDDGRSLVLTGPTVEKMDARGNVDEKSRVHWMCLAQMRIVKRSADALMIVNGWGYRGRPSAFAKDAASPWYTSKKACEKAIGPGPRAKAVSRHGCA